MEINLNKKNITIYYLGLSTISLFLLIILIFSNSSNLINKHNIERIILTFIFILCCIIGISRSIYPSWYKRILRTVNYKSSNYNKQTNNRKKTGHHPDCIKFQHHKILLLLILHFSSMYQV